jgi:hypothetical protein
MRRVLYLGSANDWWSFLMKIAVLTYFMRQVAFMGFGAMIVSLVLGALKTLVEVLFGHPFWISLQVGAVFFLIPFAGILVIGSVCVIFAIVRKAKSLGLTMEYICNLGPEERKKFRAKNGF